MHIYLSSAFTAFWGEVLLVSWYSVFCTAGRAGNNEAVHEKLLTWHYIIGWEIDAAKGVNEREICQGEMWSVFTIAQSGLNDYNN